jgi:hypothetical protein
MFTQKLVSSKFCSPAMTMAVAVPLFVALWGNRILIGSSAVIKSNFTTTFSGKKKNIEFGKPL